MSLVDMPKTHLAMCLGFSLAKTPNIKTRHAPMRLLTASAGLANLVLSCDVRFRVVNGCCCADML